MTTTDRSAAAAAPPDIDLGSRYPPTTQLRHLSGGVETAMGNLLSRPAPAPAAGREKSA